MAPGRGAGSNPQEAAQGDAAAERRDRHRAGDEHDRPAARSRSCRGCRPGRSARRAGRRSSPCRASSMATAIAAPMKPDDQALDHERPADEPVGRADEAHHLDLAAAGVDREPDRVADQQQRGERAAARRSRSSTILTAPVTARISLASSRESLTSSMIGLIGSGLPLRVRRARASLRTASRLSGSSSLTLKEAGSGLRARAPSRMSLSLEAAR